MFISKSYYRAAMIVMCVQGGFKTTEEMCLVFVSYYPRQDLSECYSRPDIAVMLDTLGVQNMGDNQQTL